MAGITTAGYTTTSNPSDVENRIRIHFSKKLLEHAKHTLRLSEFGMQGNLPGKTGSRSIRFWRKRAASTAQVVNLSESAAISTFTTVELTPVDAHLVHFGEATKITDILRMIDLFEPLSMNIDTMGEDAALQADTMCRDAIVANPAYSGNLLNDPAGSSISTLYGSNGTSEFFCGGTNPNTNSASNFTTVQGSTTTGKLLTRVFALSCLTQLKVNKAPKINGSYIAVICPQVAQDFVQDADWKNAAIYSNVQALYKGEIGMMDGARYVEATNPMAETTYGTPVSSGTVFTTLYLGKDAFGTVKLGGASSPFNPQIVIADKADKSDPLNEFITAGWKAFWTAALLNSAFVIACRSRTVFGG